MKTGIELIAKERQEQIEKHGFDLKKYDEFYTHDELQSAAVFCLTLDENYYPLSWGNWFKDNIIRKQNTLCKSDFDIEMSAIAGALLAANIDRIQSL